MAQEQNCRKGEFCHTKLAGKRVIEVGAGCGLAGLGSSLQKHIFEKIFSFL
jgi:tRNA1(Val) A37 N6-methylase TrmN6